MLSTRCYARLIDVDASDALAMSGVVDFVSYKDVPAKNRYAPLDVVPDEEETVFAADTVRTSVHSIYRTSMSYHHEFTRTHAGIDWAVMGDG